MNAYRVDILCPDCGKRHLLVSSYRLQSGPNEKTTVADFYGTQQLPPDLARLLKDAVWCTETDDCVNQQDKAKIWIGPSGQPP